MNTLETKALTLIIKNTNNALNSIKSSLNKIPGLPNRINNCWITEPPTYVEVDTKILTQLLHVSDQLEIALNWSKAILDQNTIEELDLEDYFEWSEKCVKDINNTK